MITLDDACCGDPDHAAMPPFPIEHNAISVAQCRFFFETLVDRFKNSSLFLLPLGVQAIELASEQFRLRLVFGAEKFNNICRDVHAPGGVDAGRNAKSDFP